MTKLRKILLLIFLNASATGWIFWSSGRAKALEPGPARQTDAPHFLVVCKAKAIDPLGLQQRGISSCNRLASVAATIPRATIDLLTDPLLTPEKIRTGQVDQRVSIDVFRKRLQNLASVSTPSSTVLIYTHTHGRREPKTEWAPPAGIVVDLPALDPIRAGTLPWAEYADLLLAIPAKNVVVLTMACYSGGLIEALHAPERAHRWRDRHKQENRNFVVLTAQNSTDLSEPIVIDGETINPFTFAIAQGLKGRADGFTIGPHQKPEYGPKDGHLTIGEWIDFVLLMTEQTRSESPRRPNTAKPQVTGSFDRSDLLLHYRK